MRKTFLLLTGTSSSSPAYRRVLSHPVRLLLLAFSRDQQPMIARFSVTIRKNTTLVCIFGQNTCEPLKDRAPPQGIVSFLSHCVEQSQSKRSCSSVLTVPFTADMHAHHARIAVNRDEPSRFMSRCVEEPPSIMRICTCR